MNNILKKSYIGDICDINLSTYSPSENWKFVNYLDTGNITKNKIENIQYIDLNIDKLPSRARRKVKQNNIIYSTVRPNQMHYGILTQDIPENFLVSTGFAVLDVDSTHAEPYFVYYSLIQDDNTTALQAIAEQSTSAYPSIKPSDIKNREILLPPLETQQKIAKVLSAIDDKIELNNSINNNLEQQAQAIFKSWFVDFEPFGGTLPKFAELVPIEKICKIVTKGTTPTTLGFSFVEQGINFIKAESILDNHSFDYNKFAYIDEVTYKKLSRSILEAKDIVFTIAGTLGRFAIIDEEVIPANTNQAVAIIRADIGKIEPEYLYTFFLGNWHNNYYSKRIQQAVQANLNLTTIKSLPIILLSQEYRIKYLNIIKPILWQIKYNEKENRILTQLRDTLLPKLMSGEIAVSEVDISADKLLFSEDK